MIDLQARLSTGYTARQEACAPTPHCPAAHASWPVRGWRRARAARSLAPFNVPRTTHPSRRPRVPPHPATLSEHGPPARATTNDRTRQSRRTDGISRRRMLRPPRAPQNPRATAPGCRRRPCRRALHRARVLIPRAARRKGRAGSAVLSSRPGGPAARPWRAPSSRRALCRRRGDATVCYCLNSAIPSTVRPSPAHPSPARPGPRAAVTAPIRAPPRHPGGAREEGRPDPLRQGPPALPRQRRRRRQERL